MLYTTITIKGKDYKARLNARACVDLEKRLGTNPLNVFANIANANTIPDLSSLITILHASLTAYQHGITLDDTYAIYDDFIEDGNTMIDIIPIILEIFKVSGFFKEEDAQEEVESKNVQKGQKVVKILDPTR